MKAHLVEAVQPGQEVGGYRVDRKLGAGGFGQVYLAHREGTPCALKFLLLERVGDWGWRELFILMSHELPHVVKLRGHFKWPEQEPDYLVLVMEYVPGVTLFQWARGHNPSARQVVQKLLPLARALGGVHAAGVLHRDLKGNNVLVREPDGQPVLVDFGAGALPHAPPVTRGGVAPGNLHYRTPESIAFFLRPKRERGERYAYGVKDEMYALGVMLYVLTTDGYPFDGDDEDLLEEILLGEPEPPCELDARVPVPLSELCMRMLAREPEARIRGAEELCTQLEELLKQAQGDPRWDVPLCYDWTEQGRTTEHAPELGDVPQLQLKRWIQQKPKRGPSPRPGSLPKALAVGNVSPVHPRRRGLMPGLGVVMALVVMGLSLRLGLHGVSPPGGTEPAAAPRVRAPVSSADAWLTSPVPWAVSVHEVAPPWKPPEAGAGAVPPKANTPVPVTTVMFSSGTSRMKKALGSQVEREKKRTGCTGANALLAVAAAANMACPGAQVRQDAMPQARHAPPPQACPPGAVETMTRQLGLEMHDRHATDMPGAIPNDFKIIPVKEGPVSLEVKGNWHQPPFDHRVGLNVGPMALPNRTQLIGQLYIGEKLVYGRFTQAVTPTGDTFTVCMLLRGQYGHELGMTIREVDGGVIKVYPRAEVQIVDHFE